MAKKERLELSGAINANGFQDRASTNYGLLFLKTVKMEEEIGVEPKCFKHPTV